MFLGQHPVQGEVWRLRQARLTYAQIISRVPGLKYRMEQAVVSLTHLG